MQIDVMIQFSNDSIFIDFPWRTTSGLRMFAIVLYPLDPGSWKPLLFVRALLRRKERPLGPTMLFWCLKQRTVPWPIMTHSIHSHSHAPWFWRRLDPIRHAAIQVFQLSDLSGAFFYYTADGKYMMKTVTPKEFVLLRQILKGSAA